MPSESPECWYPTKNKRPLSTHGGTGICGEAFASRFSYKETKNKSTELLAKIVMLDLTFAASKNLNHCACLLKRSNPP